MAGAPAAGRSARTRRAWRRSRRGFAWLVLALASLLSLERLFERDFEDGALDLLALGPRRWKRSPLAKCLAQWIATGAPLALAAPVAAIALGAPLSLRR